MSGRKSALLLFVAAFALSACAPQRFYPGEARPRGEVARLVTEEGAAIASVDANSFFPLPTRLDVLPGKHLVIVFYSEVEGGTLGVIDSLGRSLGAFRGPLQGCAWFEADFQAGGTYLFRLDEGETIELLARNSGQVLARAQIKPQPALTRCPAA